MSIKTEWIYQKTEFRIIGEPEILTRVSEWCNSAPSTEFKLEVARNDSPLNDRPYETWLTITFIYPEDAARFKLAFSDIPHRSWDD